jgi:hypothetical protein
VGARGAKAPDKPILSLAKRSGALGSGRSPANKEINLKLRNLKTEFALTFIINLYKIKILLIKK